MNLNDMSDTKKIKIMIINKSKRLFVKINIENTESKTLDIILIK